MIDPKQWMPDAVERLRSAFGGRLLYLGLQGSYGRGEATEASDIDLVALVDSFSLDDLDAYRAAIRSMPEGEKACGFFGDPGVLRAWPLHDLLSLKIDTTDWLGALEAFLPPFGPGVFAEAARNGAANLYHPLVHTWLYGDDGAKADCARAALKSAFFLLRILHCLRTGEAALGKRALRERLSGGELAILLAGMDVDAWMEGRSLAEAYALLLGWVKGVLAGV